MKNERSNDPNQNPLLAALDKSIAAVEVQQAELLAHDALPADGTDHHWVGTPPAQAFLGNAYAADLSALVRGCFVPCQAGTAGGVRGVVSCDGKGYIEETDENGARRHIICPTCSGAGKLYSFGGLALLRAVRESLAPSLKDDASPAALESWNKQAAETHARNQAAERERLARAEAERQVFADAQRKLDEIRNPPADPVVEEHQRREIAERHAKGGAR